MIKRFLILILIIAATISACTTNEVVTPTPFPNDDTTTPIISSGQVVPVEIAQLVENPETFEGVTVLVNGRYHPLPARVCSSASYESPATWNLVAGEGNVYMNGFDSQLNALLPESTSMTVNGVWRQWNGPIGCGKESEVAQIWFLEVHEIISPNPLVQVTLTPTVIGGEGEEIADNGEPSSFSNPETTPSAEDELVTAPAPIQPEATSQLVGTPTPFTNSNPNPTGTATAVTTPRNEEDNDGSEDDEDDTNDAEPTTAPTSSTGGSNTPTPTATISSPSGNSTPTATPLSSLTTQTPTPEPYETVIGKVYPAQGADFQLLNSAETHIWELDILADDIITIHVAAQPSIDVVVSLIDPNGDAVIDQQNNTPAGEVETIANQTLTMEDIYTLQIKTENGEGGEYAVAFYTDYDYPTVFKNILEDGDTISTHLKESDDFHFFYGNKGDSITVIADPDSTTTDLKLFILSPDDILTESPEDRGKDAEKGATETLTFTLPDNGLYSIQIYEVYFLEGDYTISLIEN